MAYAVPQGAVCEVLLETGLVRMCVKYGIEPERFMKAALMEELHTKAVSNIGARVGP